jgi:hypothetical protein
MLVQYIGLFLTGFQLGLAIAISILIVLEQFYHPSTGWINIKYVRTDANINPVRNMIALKNL